MSAAAGEKGGYAHVALVMVLFDPRCSVARWKRGICGIL